MKGAILRIMGDIMPLELQADNNIVTAGSEMWSKKEYESWAGKEKAKIRNFGSMLLSLGYCPDFPLVTYALSQIFVRNGPRWSKSLKYGPICFLENYASEIKSCENFTIIVRSKHTIFHRYLLRLRLEHATAVLVNELYCLLM